MEEDRAQEGIGESLRLVLGLPYPCIFENETEQANRGCRCCFAKQGGPCVPFGSSCHRRFTPESQPCCHCSPHSPSEYRPQERCKYSCVYIPCPTERRNLFIR